MNHKSPMPFAAAQMNWENLKMSSWGVCEEWLKGDPEFCLMHISQLPKPDPMAMPTTLVNNCCKIHNAMYRHVNKQCNEMSRAETMAFLRYHQFTNGKLVGLKVKMIATASHFCQNYGLTIPELSTGTIVKSNSEPFMRDEQLGVKLDNDTRLLEPWKNIALFCVSKPSRIEQFWQCWALLKSQAIESTPVVATTALPDKRDEIFRSIFS